jgi:hypothetical protein
METASLKSFATWARTALIIEVTARIAVVLAPASTERVEQPKVVAALEKAVKDAGGGDKGRSAVADRVAYTWFNRIIALRFMDANGYTGIGVVSPQAGVDVGQPEILAEAKRANIDPEVVSQKARETVTGLLNGTRRSDDPQGEAFALLLAEYCRHWNRSMPFMFEREGDFTELLIPANLLADESVLNRAAKVLTAEVCQDVEVIGWLYQFYISERKDEVFAGFKKNKKAGADEIPAATQLFTPHWIVRYLVENSLGRLWMLNRPTSRLVDQMEYYIAPVGEQTDFVEVGNPEQLKITDPACGSGHMLTYAFDLLYAIYEEEGYAPAEIPGLILTNNLYGTEIDPRAGSLAAFALTMQARSRQRRFFNKQVEPNVCVLEQISFEPDELEQLVTTDGDRLAEEAFWNQFAEADTYGALTCPDEPIFNVLQGHLDTWQPQDDLFGPALRRRADRVLTQAAYLRRCYHVVVANPPYMSSKNMTGALADWLKHHYSDVKADLFSAFIVRNSQLAVEGGQLGFMTPFVWMFIATYEQLRQYVLSRTTITTLVQLEYSGFEGATVPVCTFTLQNSRTNSIGSYIRLTDFKGARNQAPQTIEAISNPSVSWRFDINSEVFRKVPGSPIAYWSDAEVFAAFEDNPSFSTAAYTRIGLITGDNDRYIRQWHEVSFERIGLSFDRKQALESTLRWFPVTKGGDYRKWYGNTSAVVNWQNDGHELQTVLHSDGGRTLAHNFNLDDIFHEGVTWSKITSSNFSARLLPEGYIFNDPSAVAFPSGSSTSVECILAYLVSVVPNYLLKAINPTLNFQPGNILTLPWPCGLDYSAIREIASEAVSIAKWDWDSSETSIHFSGIPYLSVKSGGSSSLEQAIERLRVDARSATERLASLETENNRIFVEALNLDKQIEPEVTSSDVTLSLNENFVFPSASSDDERRDLFTATTVRRYISYAVGCMFGRYSLDSPGLILADQGAPIQDYLAKVSIPTFMPDADNVIPIVDGDWFEDDIVARFRQFLRAAFGDEHFEENLRFVTESLEVKDLRDYFVKSFYKDHVQRYKKRPIYWLFSSPKGSFNALIYMHRYTPSTVSTVLNEYLREYKAKLGSSLQHHERLAAGGGTPREQAAAQKESDRLRKVLLELDEYEHDVLYPLASQQIEIDLDDGVKVNYPKFGAALKKIPGLEVAE